MAGRSGKVKQVGQAAAAGASGVEKQGARGKHAERSGSSDRESNGGVAVTGGGSAKGAVASGSKPGAARLSYGLNPKQQRFFEAKQRYVAYGGARGGGKSWAVQHKALELCLKYAGIQVVIIRRRYTDLEENHIRPLRMELARFPQVAQYYGNTRSMVFYNDSRILFKHLNNLNDQDEYQGLEFDVIFMDEATQFTEMEFRMLGACLRGVNDFPKRFYLTCNPGGVGHQWVKRLFISRSFDPEKFENPRDYCFIPATVDDNKLLLESTPEYLQMLDMSPEHVRRAWRYGDWDALSGQFFTAFDPKRHVIDDFSRVPDEWVKYRVFDYGLDMLACLWIAVDFAGRAYVYRELNKSDLIVSDAARMMLDMTPEHERIAYTIAPPDMWNRQRTDGKTQSETFMQEGLGLLKAPNSRIAGWSMVNEYLKSGKDGRPMLLVAKSCKKLIEHFPAVQHDERDPDDVAKEPHELTHNMDAIRYFCAARNMKAEKAVIREEYDEGERVTGYDEAMTGGEPTSSYLHY